MITPHPKELIMDDEPEKAIEIWKAGMNYCKDVIFAWGGFKIPHGRNETAKRIFGDALCFGILKNGEPRHPMYLKSDTILIKYS